MFLEFYCLCYVMLLTFLCYNVLLCYDGLCCDKCIKRKIKLGKNCESSNYYVCLLLSSRRIGSIESGLRRTQG
jgi:hypothetical protein